MHCVCLATPLALTSRRKAPCNGVRVGGPRLVSQSTFDRPASLGLGCMDTGLAALAAVVAGLAASILVALIAAYLQPLRDRGPDPTMRATANPRPVAAGQSSELHNRRRRIFAAGVALGAAVTTAWRSRRHGRRRYAPARGSLLAAPRPQFQPLQGRRRLQIDAHYAPSAHEIEIVKRGVRAGTTAVRRSPG